MKTYDSLSERERAVLDEYLASLVIEPVISSGKDVPKCDFLDIGCGDGRFARIVGGRFKTYTGVDLNDKAIERARVSFSGNPRISYFVGDAHNLPLPQKKFDVALYGFSWHFIEDFDRALSELERVLKTDGIAIIIEPTKLTQDWRDQRLNPNSPTYDKAMHERKIKSLERAREAVYFQSRFKNKTNDNLMVNSWVLSRPQRETL